jgi:hypothetical protein
MGAGRLAFHQWMRRWDYLAEGLPGDGEIDALLRSIFLSMLREKVIDDEKLAEAVEIFH